MEPRAVIERELVEMRQKRDEIQAHLDRTLMELQQLVGAIGFGEYLLEQIQPDEKPVEEVNDDSSS